MPELITRTARLVPYAKRPKQVPSFVTAYSYEPLADEPGAALGNLFAVVEVLVSGRSSEEVADLVLGTLSEHYYNQGSTQTEPLVRFEAAVKATNHELAEYVNQGNAAWIGKLSAVVAVQIGDELHLAQTGSAEAFLYRGKAAARIAAGQGATRPAVPSKTFGSIASGQLEAGDRLLLATPALIHQLPLTKLKGVVSETSPNSAIAEITELLRGGSAERIAALVIEVTTPEQAALQVRSEEPSEIQLGSPENMVEAAKLAAAPLAHATVTTSKRAGVAAKDSWQQAKPHLQRAGHAAAGWIRHFLTSKGAKKRLLISLGVVVVATILIWQWQAGQQHTKALLERYNIDYHQYQLATDTIATDKPTAKDLLNRLQGELAELAKAPGRGQLDNQIARTAAQASGPKSVADLQALVASKLDQVEGLRHVNPTTVASFSSFKNRKPTSFEFAGNKIYVFDANNNSALYIVNTTTNDSKKSAADTAKLGEVAATTLSSAGDGIYILTKQPSVWFYKFDTDSLTEQAIGLGQWEPGTAIASYASNLYVLSNGVVYKHVKTYSGYSPKSEYLPSAQTPGATGLAVDGSVYVLGPSGLKLFLAGVLKATAEVPSSLTAGQNLRSTNNGNTLVAASPSTKRIGLWDASKALKFDQQYELSGVKNLYDATFDGKVGIVYALVDGRLVKFTP